MSRAAIAILSTENLIHNLQVIQAKAPCSGIIAMIKANAYGHGLRSVALRLEKHVQSFGVASIDEALALRHVGIKIPLTLMEGVFEPDEFLVASCQKLHVVIHDYSQVQWLQKLPLPTPLYVWLKIDTGMGRLGFTLNEAYDVHKQLSQLQQIQQPVGIMSHFACSESKDHALNAQQITLFKEFTHDLPGAKSFCQFCGYLKFSANPW